MKPELTMVDHEMFKLADCPVCCKCHEWIMIGMKLNKRNGHNYHTKCLPKGREK